MQTSRGFTFVEALATLAVAGVLASAVVPSLASGLRATRVSAASTEMLASLLLTRSEAVKRRVRVVMCRSANGESCAASGSWEQGWIVFADLNSDGDRDAGEALLHVQQPLGEPLRLTGTTTLAKYVSYAPNGATRVNVPLV